jgi:hypothetical protein
MMKVFFVLEIYAFHDKILCEKDVVQDSLNIFLGCTVFSVCRVASDYLVGDGCPLNLVRIQVLQLECSSERLYVWTQELIDANCDLSIVTIVKKVLLFTYAELRYVRNSF